MWLSFFSNIIIFVVGVLLYLTYHPKYKRDFSFFMLSTAVAALLGAFGHLKLLDLQLQAILLFGSRIVNLISFFVFTKGTLSLFGYHTKYKITFLHRSLFIIMAVWLIYLNLSYPGSKLGFRPVMTYGIIEMLVLCCFLLIKYYKENPLAHSRILLGISVVVVSALIFKIMPEGLGVKPSDISHLLVALSLVVMSTGFIKLETK